MYDPFSLDWVGVDNPWNGVSVDLAALQGIVAQVLRVPARDCGSPVEIGLQQESNYARVFSFRLPSQCVVARLVAPVKPLFKTESEVAAMDFVRGHTSLPVPKVIAYCPEADNPVGVEWLIMEHMPGVTMGEAWNDLEITQKRRLALDLVDFYDQMSLLKANKIGGIYHGVRSMDDSELLAKSAMFASETKFVRAPRWKPLSAASIQLLKTHCSRSVIPGYEFGPIHDVSLLRYGLVVPSPSQTMPICTSEAYVKLLAFNGNPTTRSDYDFPTREKCVELFQSIWNLYPHSSIIGPSSDLSNFCFSHGDLHDGNILIDPRSGAITGIIDWESAAFRPLWSEIRGVGWFEEDRQRFMRGCDDPGNFADDTTEDIELRAFFRTELQRRNSDLFSCFLGGVELRAVLDAATDDPRPYGHSVYFLSQHRDIYWSRRRRGPFPFDMDAWLRRWVALDAQEMARVKALQTNVS